MILADTSVWIEHLRRRDGAFSALLREGSVLSHPFVIEELACGSLQNREEILSLLGTLHPAPLASHAEFLHFVQEHRLAGAGLGLVDVHLLMSARLAHAGLLSHDRPLEAAARRLKIPRIP